MLFWHPDQARSVLCCRWDGINEQEEGTTRGLPLCWGVIPRWALVRMMRRTVQSSHAS